MGDYEAHKAEVLNCARWLCENGYFGGRLGSGGNVSMMIRETGGIVITPSRLSYQQMRPEDVCVIDADRHRLEGRRMPSIEAGMHIGIYAKRPEVRAVVHTHQPYASVLSLINRPIPALFDEITVEIGPRVELIPYARSGSEALVANVVDRLGNGCSCYILQNHGALSLGRDLSEAMRHAELLEKAAQVYYYALCTGDPVSRLPEPAIRHWLKIRKELDR
jgi:ribulose-5-phosphate 4-epimerase/fuculose-1-phosphate aldolase